MKVRLELVQRLASGILCPYPAVRLRVQDRYGTWVPLLFRIDTQADLTAIPLTLARRQGIPFTEDRPGAMHGIAGTVEKFRGRLRLLIAGREHEWPCDFVAAPMPPAGQTLPELAPVLGRAGFLDEFALTIDSGFLTLTRLGPLRRWWRRRLQTVWASLGLLHPIDEPL